MVNIYLHIDGTQHHQSIANKLFLDTDFTDVTLVSQDKQHVSAHRAVLSASSDFFRCILYISLQQNMVTYHVEAESDIIQALLKFIYLGHCTIQEKKEQLFFSLAEQWGIKIFQNTDERRHGKYSGNNTNTSSLIPNKNYQDRNKTEPKMNFVNPTENILEPIKRHSGIDSNMADESFTENSLEENRAHSTNYEHFTRNANNFTTILEQKKIYTRKDIDTNIHILSENSSEKKKTLTDKECDIDIPIFSEKSAKLNILYSAIDSNISNAIHTNNSSEQSKTCARMDLDPIDPVLSKNRLEQNSEIIYNQSNDPTSQKNQKIYDGNQLELEVVDLKNLKKEGPDTLLLLSTAKVCIIFSYLGALII